MYTSINNIGIIASTYKRFYATAIPTSSVTQTSSVFFTTFTSGGSPKDILVYIPPNYDSSQQYPSILFYHGDGAKGKTITITNQALQTADGVQKVFSGSFTNDTSSADVLFSSVKLKQNGIIIGTGTSNSKITGSLISNSNMSYTTRTGSFYVSMSVAPVNGTTFTIDYKHSLILKEGIPVYLNSGDEPPGVFIFSPQITATDFDEVLDFDNVITAFTGSYNLNQNRILATGLSRGGFECRELMQNRYAVSPGSSSIAATLLVSCDYSTGWQPWTTYTDIGNWWHHGTADGTVTNGQQTLLTNANTGVDLNLPPETTAYWGKDHEAYVWNTSVYNRKNRTDSSGTALFDYVDWLTKFSKEPTERATLFTQLAERYNNLDDYRRALLQVNALTSSATQTSLLTRLSTVRSNIGTIYNVSYTVAISQSIGNYNNITGASAGNSISNLIDSNGTSSAIGFQTVAQFTTSGTKITNIARLRANYHGLPPEFNTTGATISTASLGSCKFTGLNNSGSYTVRIYSMSYTAGINTAQGQLDSLVSGSSQTLYTEVNSYYPIEYTNIKPISGEITIAASASATRASFINGFDLILQP